MSEKELPAGWVPAQLGDVLLTIEAGKSFACEPRQADVDEWGIIKVSAMTWGLFDERENKAVPDGRPINPAYEIRPGDILVSRANTRAYVGAPVLVGQCRSKLLLSDKSLRLVPSDLLSKKWLVHLLGSPEMRQWISDKATGTKDSMRNISQQVLLDAPFLLPPREEQDRVVEALEDHLSRLDAAGADLELAGVKVDRLISAVQARAVTGGFSRRVEADEAMQPSEVHEESRKRARRRWTATTPTAVPGFFPPENWTVVSLGSLCYESGYGTSTKCAQDAAGSPVLRIPNVQGGSIDLSDVKNAVDDSIDLSKYFLSAGDLLFVRTNGSPGLIGRVGVVREALDAAFASYLIRFRLVPGLVEPRWIHLVTQSPLWRREIERRAASSAGQYNLNIESLSSLPVPLPPVEVQRETLRAVDAKVDAARRLSGSAELAKARAEHLRNSLLRQAFYGQLTLQDPADEPATALLARIQAERAAQPRAKRARRAPAASPKAKAPAISAPVPSPTPAPTHAVQQEFAL